MTFYLQVVVICCVLIYAARSVFSLGYDNVDRVYQVDLSPANLVYQIDRKLDALADTIAFGSPAVILCSLQRIMMEVGGQDYIVSAIAHRRLAANPAVLALLGRRYPLTSRAVPPPDDQWPTDPAMLFDLLLAGHRYDMGQYMQRVRVSAAHLPSIAPFLENRDVRAVLAQFMDANRSLEIAALLEIPLFGDTLWRQPIGVYLVLDAMNRNDEVALSALCRASIGVDLDQLADRMVAGYAPAYCCATRQALGCCTAMSSPRA